MLQNDDTTLFKVEKPPHRIIKIQTEINNKQTCFWTINSDLSYPNQARENEKKK